mgnify:CR=1 FL=1
MYGARRGVAFLIVAVALSGCGDTKAANNGTNNAGETNNVQDTEDAGGDDTGSAPDAAETPDGGAVERAALGCDPLDEAACALPWPSNLYLAPDSERQTGYTITFGTRSLPANAAGVNVDPKIYQRMDGYSLGTSLVAVFPGLDPALLPDEEQIERSVADDAHMVIFEMDGESVARKVPYWVDLDAQEADLAKRAVIGHPAEILKEGTRYIVAFRGLTDASGAAIPRSEAFARLVAGDTSSDPELFFRQGRFDEIFATLEAQGWAKDDLTLAWDFVTASSESLHGRMLHMIDDALAATGPSGPEMTITDVVDFTEAEDPYVAAELRGTIRVPHYMRPFGGVERTPQRWELNLDEVGVPQQNGTRDAKFWIRIPRSSLDGTPHGLVMYGHGLLGSGTQVRGSFNGKIANDHQLIFYAADMIGMSVDEGDGAALEVVQDFNKFPILGDRLQQGMLEWVLLGRAMRERFPTLPEVTNLGVSVNTDEMFYSGISQGGIFGATLTALSPDIDRGHLGVPGHTYSVLLHRSVDFDLFFTAMKASYPDTRDQILLLSLAQLQWDATDPVSYYRRLATPLSGRNPKEVLLAPAKGDYQVAPIQSEVVARSDLGIALLENYDDERSPALIEPASYPHDGSGVVLYDFGDQWPAPGNHTDSFPFGEACEGDATCDVAGGWECCSGTCCRDPHGKVRYLDSHNQQMVTFFRTGVIEDVCGGDGCHPE